MKVTYRDLLGGQQALNNLLGMSVAKLGPAFHIKLAGAAREIAAHVRDYAETRDALCREYDIPHDGQQWDFSSVISEPTWDEFRARREELLNAVVDINLSPIWVQNLTVEQARVITGNHQLALYYLFKESE